MLRTAGKDVQAMREMVMDAPTAEVAGLTCATICRAWPRTTRIAATN